MIKKVSSEKQPFRYFNRELSWLAFNRRVLEQAQSSCYPLLERMKFLAFVSSNLDEFFEIRVAGLIQQIKSGVVERGPDGLDANEQLVQIESYVKELLLEQNQCWKDSLLPELESAGIRFLNYRELNVREKQWVKHYFEEYIYPILTPLAIDPAHPFPQLINKALYILASLKQNNSRKKDSKMAIIPVPRILPRVVKIEVPRKNKDEVYIFLSDIIEYFINTLFQGYRVKSATPFRITRNSELYIDDEEVKNLLNKIEEELVRREKGAAVRLEICKGFDRKMLKQFMGALDLEEKAIYETDGPINPLRLMGVYDLIKRSDLKFPHFSPKIPKGFELPELIFDNIAKKDLLLHQPYDSFQPFIDFIEQAAKDPKVFAIKQTLYRTSGDSPIVKALMDASKNGKQVTAIVEIKARFDEANNIHWAKKLEDVGVHVVYGIVGLKTHCKTCMVVRREGKKLKHYVHLSTGNYNQKTARLYTDFSFFTAKKKLTSEVAALFNTLTGYAHTPAFKHLLVAPFNFHSSIQKNIKREIKNALAGYPARIMIQANSLVDQETIDNLYRASQAGVKIDLIIRGICNIVPRVKGLSENINVRSILGRFLEHSRIYYFENSSKGDALLYLGSADAMPRNFFKRIECVFPIESAEERNRILKILEAYLKDNTQANTLLANGEYKKIKSTSQASFSAQDAFIDLSLQSSLRSYTQN
ncbi:MAG: Polyphosphate kinase [Puniceicoccaceae bacterium MED-G32]|nr:MAG: Polyphosphate kinase [Puniceicoccaceae bacterium MED-G32]|tara:strand:+ start:2016 stop:4121 length:2106 start_codon:yes stop_codon:yes gene_type:complete